MEQQAQTANTAPALGNKGGSLLLDIQDAGDFLGLTVWQVRGLVSEGLPVVRVGRKFYFRRTSLTRWAERAEGKA